MGKDIMPTPTRAPAAPRLPALVANGDGALTLADAGSWLLHAYFLPGDCCIRVVSA